MNSLHIYYRHKFMTQCIVPVMTEGVVPDVDISLPDEQIFNIVLDSVVKQSFELYSENLNLGKVTFDDMKEELSRNRGVSRSEHLDGYYILVSGFSWHAIFKNDAWDSITAQYMKDSNLEGLKELLKTKSGWPHHNPK